MDSLPPEVWLQVVSFISPSNIPSWTPVPMRQPNLDDEQFFTRDSSRVNSVSRAPLKQLSLTCRACRDFVVPELFRCLRVYIDHIAEERNYLQDMIAVIQRLELRPVARTVAVYSFANHGGKRKDSDEYTQLPGSLDRFVEHTWDELFSNLDISRMILVALPWNMSMLLQSRTDFGDSWSFRIPYQRVELTTAEAAPPAQQGMEAGMFSCAPPCSERLQQNYIALERYRGRRSQFHSGHAAPRARSLLSRQPWTSVAYYGGSHLNNYGTYHYFEKLPPCILTWHLPLSERPLSLPYDPSTPRTDLSNHDAAPSPSPFSPLVSTFQHVTEFKYSAIFPHYAHITRIVPVLAQLTALRTLALQLAPDPASAVLDDLELIGRGNLSLRDCWAEIERGYARVLEVLVSRVSSIALPFLQTFISEDCKGIVELRGELVRLVTRWAPEWCLIATGTWTRSTSEEQELAYLTDPSSLHVSI